MYQYKLTEIVFNNEEKIQLGNLTVIIGPNNCGKSRALKDIAWKTTKNRDIPGVIVSDVDWVCPQNLQELCEAYKLERYQDKNGNWMFRKLAAELNQEQPPLNANNWNLYKDNPEHLLNKLQFAGQFGFALIAFLTTEYRLQLVNKSPSHADEIQESNLLQTLYNAGSDLEKQIQELVKSAFGKEIKLDFTVPQRLLLRIRENFDEVPVDPRDARSIMEKYEKLDEQGDGIRSFVGIIIALMAIKRDVFLIDEPEVFLHPPQAFKMGEFIAEQSNSYDLYLLAIAKLLNDKYLRLFSFYFHSLIQQRKSQIILATHSADLLRGILSKTKDVKIIRIDRRENTNYFHKLKPDKLEELVNDPLLMTARVLDGLFYSGVVVVEGDRDARFYQAVSNKLGNDMDIHFVNADNKQTVPKIIEMYRSMGVRCAGIVDFDILKIQPEFKKQLESLGFSQEEISRLLSIREEIAKVAQELPPDERINNAKEKLSKLLDYIEDNQNKKEPEKLLRDIKNQANEIVASTNWKNFKEKGRGALPTEELQSKFDDLWRTCSEKGLFINPLGELESMLVDENIPYTSNKRNWLIKAMEKLPELKVNNDKYLWKFIKEIQDYIYKKD
ncbi:ATP-dependent nuclease [Dapis sp. BLCC M126]|uniref:ATP-dependent nuclease n=1 Tax=Dapis sp. BLCC M126 TaxID=3400189 RepID=UPI003CF03549